MSRHPDLDIVENNTEPATIRTEAGTGADLALAAAEPAPLDVDETYHVLIPAGAVSAVLNLDYLRPGPRRPAGNVEIWDAASFIDYVRRHATARTELYVDSPNSRIIAVLNSHEPQTDDGATGWGDHRATLVVRTTPDWQRWTKSSGVMFKQADFAEFIEDNLPTIVEPAAANMLELAQTFEATTGVEFESSTLLDSGQRRLTYKETTNARAGQAGTIEIPKEISLGLRPYEGGDGYRITARFRYRITGSTLTLGYVLNRPEDTLRAAFDDILTVVTAGLAPSPEAVGSHQRVPFFSGLPAVAQTG